MADEFSFTKNVADVRSPVANVPVVERHVAAQQTSTPDFQSATHALAASQNNLSAIGAKVAQSASNQMAVQLGTAQGKTPHGDLMPSLTEFDENFAQSYHAQAGATLSQQGNQLLSDAQIEMAKSPRLTPELIARTHAQVQSGLKNIAAQAPTAIKTQLQSTFDSQLLNHTTQASERMIREQREDQKNNLANGIQVAIKNINELQQNGDNKAAAKLIDSVNKMADSGHASAFFTPEEARIYKETAIQTGIDGHYINLATQAQRDGKLAEFEKEFAKGPAPGMTHEQWSAAGHAVIQQTQFIENLQKQDQDLQLAKFNLAVLENPTTAGANLAALKSQVTPQQFVDAQIKLVTASNKANKISQAAQRLAGNLTNTNAFSGATHQEKNGAFDLNVQAYLQDNQKSGGNMSVPEAQLHIAMTAAGTIPKYVETLRTQASSTDPMQIMASGHSIQVMYASGNAQKLQGLGDDASGMFEKFTALRSSMPDVEAAQKAHEIIYGKTKEQKDANNAAWTEHLKTKTGSTQGNDKFFLAQANISPNALVRNSSLYAGQIKNTYESYFKMLNGDAVTAQKMLQKNIALTYGETNINGQPEFTFLPIEKILNLPDNASGIIQYDVANQLAKQFEQTKALYDDNRSDFYWEVRPQIHAENVQNEIEKLKAEGYTSQSLRVQTLLHDFHNKNGVDVVRHWRNNTVEKYDTVLQASPYSTVTTNPKNPVEGGWEVMLKSDNGVKSIGLLDHTAGVITYRPDVERLKDEYGKLHLNDNKESYDFGKYFKENHPNISAATSAVVEGVHAIRKAKKDFIKSHFSENK